jgi:Zn-dependent protease
VGNSTTLRIAIYAMLFASIILHEISHGWSALALGDDTAKRAGRLSLNPIVHVDLLGTIIVPAVLIISHSGFVFGWAKPVPVNVGRLRHPRNGAVVTGLAGPATNIVLAALACVAFHLTQPVTYWPFNLLFYFGLLNVYLAAFNLMPIPPLDGSSVVERLLPKSWWGPYLAIRPYTLLVVFALIFLGSRTGVLNAFYNDITQLWINVL